MPASSASAELAQRFVIRLDVVPSRHWMEVVASWEAADEAERAAATEALLAALNNAQLHGAAIFLAHAVEEHVFDHWSLAGYRGRELVEIADRTITLASQAAFALLAREALAHAHFDVLYAPFAEVLPLAELERARQ